MPRTALSQAQPTKKKTSIELAVVATTMEKPTGQDLSLIAQLGVPSPFWHHLVGVNTSLEVRKSIAARLTIGPSDYIRLEPV